MLDSEGAYGAVAQGGTDEVLVFVGRRCRDRRHAGVRFGQRHHYQVSNSRTGPLNVNSTGQTRGYEFWRDEVNAAGGIKAGSKNYKVKFVSYDDQSVGGRVQQLYTRLVNQDKAQFLFSPYSSGLTAPAAVISEQYGKIMIVSGGAEEKPFEQGNKYLFMVITSADPLPFGAVAALKRNTPHAKIAMVYSDDPFSKTVLAAAAKQAKDAGLRSRA